MEYAKVLVVDDDNNMTLILKEILTEMGHQVGVASTAEEAMKQVETEEFFIVITDIQMPGKSGIDLLKQIKRFNSLIQVFIMTAHSNKDRVIECLKAGATDYFEKPFHTEDILISIQSAIYRIQKWAKLVVTAH